MRAVMCTRYGSPEVLKLQEVETPVPQGKEVLIKIMASVVSPPDCVFRKGKPFISRFFTGFLKPKNAIPGEMFSGEIASVGKDVVTYKKGDLVFGTAGMSLGALGEYIVLPEDGVFTIKPNSISHNEAAAICDGALTALPFLRDKGKVHKGQSVLINGASGGIGTFAVQLAKSLGAEVTGVCSSSNIEMVKSLGADYVIDYTKENFTRSGKSYDVIFDAVGKSSFYQCKNSLADKGIYLTTVPTLAIIIQMAFTSRSATKKAIFAATGLRKPIEKKKDLEFFKELIEAGKLRSVIDRVYPLEDTGDAHRYVEKGHKRGNVIITVA